MLRHGRICFPNSAATQRRTDNNFMTNAPANWRLTAATDFFGIVDGLDLLPQYREKRKSRCEKAKRDGFGTSVSYDFGGSDFCRQRRLYSPIARGRNLQRRGTGDKAEARATGVSNDANDIYVRPSIQKPGDASFKRLPIKQNFESGYQYPV